jgi:hypothetical protein
MKFKEGAKIKTSDFWHVLIDIGYIKPGTLLEDEEDVFKVKRAIALLERLKMEAKNHGVLEEF